MAALALWPILSNKDVYSFNHQIKCLTPPGSSLLSHSEASFSKSVVRGGGGKRRKEKEKNSLIFINRESHLFPVTIFDLSK